MLIYQIYLLQAFARDFVRMEQLYNKYKRNIWYLLKRKTMQDLRDVHLRMSQNPKIGSQLLVVLPENIETVRKIIIYNYLIRWDKGNHLH